MGGGRRTVAAAGGGLEGASSATRRRATSLLTMRAVLLALLGASAPAASSAQGLFACEDACWAATNNPDVMFKGGACDAVAGNCEPCAMAGFFVHGAMATAASDCITCPQGAELDVAFSDCTGYCVKQGQAERPYSAAAGVTCTPVCPSPEDYIFEPCGGPKEDSPVAVAADMDMSELTCMDLCLTATSDPDIMFAGGECGAEAGECGPCTVAGYYPYPGWAIEANDCIACPKGYELDVVHDDCTGYCVKMGSAVNKLEKSECAAPCPPEEVEAYEFGMCDAAMLMQEQCGAEFDACAADEACAPCIDSTTQGRRLQSMWFDTQSDQVLNELQACQEGCSTLLLEIENSIRSKTNEGCDMSGDTATSLLQCMLLEVVGPSLEEELAGLCDGAAFVCPGSIDELSADQAGTTAQSQADGSAAPRHASLRLASVVAALASSLAFLFIL